MSIIRANSVQPTIPGQETYQVHRAWGTYNMLGTAAIIDSGNVTSLTDMGVGMPRFSLTTALPNAGGAVHNEPGIYDDGRTIPVQTGGRIMDTTTVDLRCGGDTITFIDWQLGGWGVMA